MSEIGEKYLPVGTGVMLKGATKRLMITGFCGVENEKKEKMRDYSGCMYPEGFLSLDQIALFDHNQIANISHLGLADDQEEKAFKNNSSHNIDSYAIKLENKYFKIVYTGDVGCDDINGLVDFCEDADLLICESSFVKSHNAVSKRHLHAYEAANLAKKANVTQLMLTHFWPETSKSEYLSEAAEIFDNSIIAEENISLVIKSRES